MDKAQARRKKLRQNTEDRDLRIRAMFQRYRHSEYYDDLGPLYLRIARKFGVKCSEVKEIVGRPSQGYQPAWYTKPARVRYPLTKQRSDIGAPGKEFAKYLARNGEIVPMDIQEAP